MPELPDLTIYQKNLGKRFLQNKVNAISVYRTKRVSAAPDELSKAIRGSTLLHIGREGKELQFCFSSGHCLSVHLMLKGQFDIAEDPSDVQYKSLSIDFGPAGHLVVSDPKGWATFTFDPERSNVPDALSEDFDLAYLREKLHSVEPTPMKGFLIDQEIVRGIGNAYADEILYDCRISPLSSSKTVPEKVIPSLYESIQNVLQSAITRLLNETPDAINGEYRDFMKIHNPNKTHSPGGSPIHIETISTRKTYFTDEQVLY